MVFRNFPPLKNVFNTRCLCRPRWWKLEFTADPDKHLVVHNVRSLPEGEFVARARALLGRGPKKEVLVFIHGFRVPFREGLLTAAQLAYDLQFEGLAALPADSPGVAALKELVSALHAAQRGNKRKALSRAMARKSAALKP